MTFEHGPYVQAACFCDMVLEDKTGVLSLIRIIDTLTHFERGSDPPQQMPQFGHRLKLVLMLKSGRAQGRHVIRVMPELPTGEADEPVFVSVHLSGEERGHNLIADLQYVFRMEGLYWFRVLLNDEPLTAIPLRVRYEPVRTGTSEP